MFYLCRENKGADQLHSYSTADLHLCYCLCKEHHDAAHFKMVWIIVLQIHSITISVFSNVPIFISSFTNEVRFGCFYR